MMDGWTRASLRTLTPTGPVKKKKAITAKRTSSSGGGGGGGANHDDDDDEEYEALDLSQLQGISEYVDEAALFPCGCCCCCCCCIDGTTHTWLFVAYDIVNLLCDPASVVVYFCDINQMLARLDFLWFRCIIYALACVVVVVVVLPPRYIRYDVPDKVSLKAHHSAMLTVGRTPLQANRVLV